MKTIRIGIVVVIFAALFTWDAQITREENRASELIECSNAGPDGGSNAQCDSCYHAIYGANDLGCGLCPESTEPNTGGFYE
jgi:hypothetical protein